MLIYIAPVNFRFCPYHNYGPELQSIKSVVHKIDVDIGFIYNKNKTMLVKNKSIVSSGEKVKVAVNQGA